MLAGTAMYIIRRHCKSIDSKGVGSKGVGSKGVNNK